MTDLDPMPGSPGHPDSPTQEAMRIAERHFLASLKVASEAQLYAMEAVFMRLAKATQRDSVAWKLSAVSREIARRERLPF
jgi:hypothetical protein